MSTRSVAKLVEIANDVAGLRIKKNRNPCLAHHCQAQTIQSGQEERQRKNSTAKFSFRVKKRFFVSFDASFA